MEMIVLIIHLLVSICLIGLVLLQRSEGGALGMGGGGGGSLMTGRGAADALAKMTSVAGGFFLVTSLSLTVLSGAAATSSGNSVFDLIQGSEPPALTPPLETPAEPETAPDPTESSLPQNSGDTQLAALGPAPAAAAPVTPSSSAPRAGPLETRSPQPAGPVPASATGTQRPVTPPAAATRSPTATVQPAAAPPTRAPVIPNTSGSVGGINLEDDGQTPAESIEIDGDGLGAVRRERAGPDQ